MIRRKKSVPRTRQRRRWWPTPSIIVAGVALFIVLGGSAVAATRLIKADDIAPGAVTSQAIRNGAVEPKDLSAGAWALLEGGQGVAGAKGDTGAAGAAGGRGEAGSTGATGGQGENGSAGSTGAKGETGSTGSTGARGETGSVGNPGSNGANGANGPNGANGTNGAEGAKGADGAKGAEGPKGAAGTNGTNGTITPLSAKQGLTALPTGVPATSVVELAVPAGSYVVMAKTQLFQTGAGDSVECLLKAGTTTLDQAAMKTLPALASVPASLQAVATTTASPTTLSVLCSVSVANGTANSSSLIAIPTA
jgi:Collagen triple helix repeat (20 copies)